MKLPWKQFPYVWSHLGPFRLSALGVGLVLFSQIFLAILLPLPIKFILNKLMPAKSDTSHEVLLYGWNFGSMDGGQALLLLSLLAFGIGAVFILSGLLEQIWTGKLAFRLHENMRRDLISRVFTRQQSYLESKKKVDLLGRISSDVSNMEILVTQGLAMVVRDFPMIFILLGMMFSIHFQLSLAFTLCLPIYYCISHFFTVWMRKTTRTFRRKTVTFEEETYESIQSMAVAKSLRGEEKLFQKLLQRVSELSQTGVQVLWSNQGLETSVGLAQFLVRGMFIFLGCWAIFRQEIGLGDLFQLLAYMDTLSKHINNINKFLSKYPKTAASMERLEELNGELSINPETSGSLELDPTFFQNSETSFSFQNVSFEHKEGKPLFQEFTFHFPKNSLIALVGPSGIGKSSFARLLNRLNDPVQGNILVAGRDNRDFTLTSLRTYIRIISQETLLLSGTVRENLELAETHPRSEQELIDALLAVNGWDFVRSLPLGLETKIGEGGHQLSGGQAKRIHLARAFLDQRSKIILFDEPTTGLDTLSSQLVMHSIQDLAKEKTVLWITHRMQEVFYAQNILFFQQNKNPLFSTVSELLESNELFRALMEQKEESQPKPKENYVPTVEEEDPMDKREIFS